MSKVITFSRFFPAYHPRKGYPTYFVEKILSSLNIAPADFSDEVNHIIDAFEYFNGTYKPKHHTIRVGNRWKVGDKFSPRVWSGKPYNSKQIIIAPDIEIVNVWDFEIKNDGIYINGECFYYYLQGVAESGCDPTELALNDGLSVDDMFNWFQYPKPFKGQIISWSDKINY